MVYLGRNRSSYCTGLVALLWRQEGLGAGRERRGHCVRSWRNQPTEVELTRSPRGGRGRSLAGSPKDFAARHKSRRSMAHSSRSTKLAASIYRAGASTSPGRRCRAALRPAFEPSICGCQVTAWNSSVTFSSTPTKITVLPGACCRCFSDLDHLAAEQAVGATHVRLCRCRSEEASGCCLA